MIMCFRGGSIGHSSTRAATDIFKDDRDDLDIVSQRRRKEPQTDLNAEEDDGVDVDEMSTEILDGERDTEAVIDEEGQLSDSELVDYGYEPEIESDDEEVDDDREAGEEDATAVDDYADY